MATVCLLLSTFSTGDAVGNDVAGMYAALRALGVDTHIFADHCDSDCQLPVEPFERYAAHEGRSDTITVYHQSISWSAGARRFLRSAGPKVVRYHNITPAAFFEPYCREIAHACDSGRRETEALVCSDRVDLFLAASSHNLRELERLGAPAARCRRLPPLHAVDDLLRIAPSLPTLERYVDRSANVLFIGRVVPNKGHRHLLGVLAAFRRLFPRPVRLFIVGDLQASLNGYQQELRELAQALGVADRVVWTGKVSAAELKAYLLLAHAFLVMSEHEGFCVPLVEAMAHSIPVVAYRVGGVAETVGDAGILLDGLDYDQYAAALEVVISRPDIRDALITRQQHWVCQQFASDVLAQQFVAAIARFLDQRSSQTSSHAG
jgi:glycosyltransferase involved in cell wall biosynthesis